MSTPVEILNGDDRAHALRTLKRAIRGATGANREHLQAVLRSLNPDATRSRASKGVSAMAKTTKKATHRAAKPTHKTKRKHNPTAGTYELRTVGHQAKASVKAASRKAVSHLKSLDIKGVLLEGFGIGFGALGSSFIAKQSEKILPKAIPAIARTVLASGLVAGVALVVGGSKGITRSIAAGSIGEALRSIGRSYAPSYFAGAEEEYYDAQNVAGLAEAGYWDSETGQWIPAQDMAGIYDPAFTLPGEERPVGI